MIVANDIAIELGAALQQASSKAIYRWEQLAYYHIRSKMHRCRKCSHWHAPSSYSYNAAGQTIFEYWSAHYRERHGTS
ncbi:hypothetical protein QEH42_gp071 [Microbacterium phage Pumpernickel]|uniref:Uncharacterized protein n=1 Tax=Microbacterium phage Pumpernickel TaxID=2885983 RepID=A0AAE8Y7L0_9CAUD|nr:hypothetical protein QEH42_gp071 [Microbacterium phage Pumpernickel]UDL15862.1 hypothetical protein SEA_PUMPERNICKEL_71 [Microbacterium phage Pumpernickel]